MRAINGPKVLHVTTVDISLDLLLLPQLREIRGAGCDVETASAPGPHVEKLRSEGFVHHPLHHATRSMRPVADLRFAAEMFRLFRATRPDIVHTHTPKPGWFGRPAARLARVPAVVNTVHGLYATPDDSWSRKALVYGLERAAAACSHAELVQSRDDVATLLRLRVPAERVIELGNGIDLKRFQRTAQLDQAGQELRRSLGFGPEDVVVGAVGRLVWEKGLRELIDAAGLLRKTHPNVRIVVIGPPDPSKADGLTASELDDVTERSGVVFLGPRDDVEVAYSAFDVYVLASHREGFPRSAMEAAAMELPLVVTDIRGCRQVVDHRRNGLLTPVRDHDALAHAIGELADSPELRRTMGLDSKAKAARDFDQSTCVATTVSIYSRLLQAAGRSVAERIAS